MLRKSFPRLEFVTSFFTSTSSSSIVDHTEFPAVRSVIPRAYGGLLNRGVDSEQGSTSFRLCFRPPPHCESGRPWKKLPGKDTYSQLRVGRDQICDPCRDIGRTSLSILTSPLYLQKFDTVPYPEQALKYLKTRGISGNVFNEHIWGGYIIYRSYPELKPYIDGRFFHKRFYDEFNPILAGRTGWEKAIDHYDISIAILAYSKGDDLRLNDRLFQNPRWRLVFWDDISLVYLKDTEKNRKVLELYGNDLLNPDRDLFAEHTERTLSAVRRLSEIADRNLQYAKDSTKALIVSGNALFALGEYAKARERFQAALSTPQPHDPWIYYKIALCYRAEGDLSNAGEFARRSLQLVPGSQVAQTLLREVQFLQRSQQQRDNSLPSRR